MRPGWPTDGAQRRDHDSASVGGDAARRGCVSILPAEHPGARGCALTLESVHSAGRGHASELENVSSAGRASVFDGQDAFTAGRVSVLNAGNGFTAARVAAWKAENVSSAGRVNLCNARNAFVAALSPPTRPQQHHPEAESPVAAQAPFEHPLEDGSVSHFQLAADDDVGAQKVKAAVPARPGGGPAARGAGPRAARLAGVGVAAPASRGRRHHRRPPGGGSCAGLAAPPHGAARALAGCEHP